MAGVSHAEMEMLLGERNRALAERDALRSKIQEEVERLRDGFPLSRHVVAVSEVRVALDRLTAILSDVEGGEG